MDEGSCAFPLPPSIFGSVLRGFKDKCVIDNQDGFFRFVLSVVRIHFMPFFSIGLNVSYGYVFALELYLPFRRS